MPDKPDPPVFPDIDLKDFAFTPIYRARLFGSSFHARANDAEWRAGMTLWLKSQDQVPAGSLPKDDIDLCRLAELGRDLRTWRKIKETALRGWYECSDGRLYHEVVAEIVKEQWQRKCAQRDRTEAARAARAAKRLSLSLSHSENSLSKSENSSVTDNVTGSKGQGQGQGQGDSTVDPDGSTGANAPHTPAPPARDPTKELWDRGVAQLGGSSRSMIGKARREFGDLAVMAAIIACEQEAPSEPIEFFLKCMETRKHRGNGKQQSPVEKLYEGAFLAAEEWERRQGDRGDNLRADVPLLDRRRSH